MSDSLQPHGLQHARLLCSPLSPRVCSNSCPLRQWCYLSISLLLWSLLLLLFSCQVLSDSSRPHELQPARFPCPSPSPGVQVHWVGDAIQPSHLQLLYYYRVRISKGILWRCRAAWRPLEGSADHFRVKRPLGGPSGDQGLSARQSLCSELTLHPLNGAALWESPLKARGGVVPRQALAEHFEIQYCIRKIRFLPLINFIH